MHKSVLPPLRINDLEIYPPIIQGAMGVRVSRAGLASAVANEGCVGVIAGVVLGKFENLSRTEFVKANEEALRYEIRKAKSMTDGILGVNVMVAVSDYENLVRAAVEENIDLIISGAGLPLELPKFLDGKDIKLIPVVSSARAFKVICRRWTKRFHKAPDGVIVEGVKAGGHLGFSHQSIVNGTAPALEKITREVIEIAQSLDPPVPVIAAGGIFDGKDIARFLTLGASGVQMATRFVCTVECDVHENFKQAYLDAQEEDIVIISSPVGMPGRAIRNRFVERIEQGETMPFRCSYRCLRTCDVTTAPYCIAKALANAADGNLDESFVFAGANAYKCHEIIPVKQLIEQLVQETHDHLTSG